MKPLGSSGSDASIARQSKLPTWRSDGSVRIRPARIEDLDRIAQVEATCFSAPWNPGAFRSLIGRPGVYLLVAELDWISEEVSGSTISTKSSRIVGHGILWRAAEEAELANLAVDPAFRGQGVAGALLDRLIDEASGARVTSVFLEVRASNEAALVLYVGRGFHQVGLRRHYYDQPREDARVLQLTLASGSGGGMPEMDDSDGGQHMRRQR